MYTMNYKTKKPSFAGIFMILIDKREQLDELCERHPTAENKANANSVRLQLMQMGAIMFKGVEEQIWN